MANHIIRYWADCVRAESVLEKGISIYSRTKAVLYAYERDKIIFGAGEADASNHEKLRALASYASSKGQAVYYGYPVLFYRDASSGKWEVAPLFIVEVKFYKPSGSLWVEKIDALPMFGVQALTLLGLRGEQIGDLNEQLTSTYSSSPNIPGDVLARCMALLSTEATLNICEPLNPNALTNTTALSKRSTPGVYNKSLFFVGDDTGYNVNLLCDLFDLGNSGDIGKTSLSALFEDEDAPTEGREPERPTNAPLLPFPLNEYQLCALQEALHKRLSIITGPPGTGKSQFIADLMVNILFSGQSVLLVSHTNEAVNVIGRRFQDYPGLLMRTGRKDIRQDLNRQFGELELRAQRSSASIQEDRHDIETLWREIVALRGLIRKRASLAAQLESHWAGYERQAQQFGGSQKTMAAHGCAPKLWNKTVSCVRKLLRIQTSEQQDGKHFVLKLLKTIFGGYFNWRKGRFFRKVLKTCPHPVKSLIDPAANLKQLCSFEDARWHRLLLYVSLDKLWSKIDSCKAELRALEPCQSLTHALRDAEQQYTTACRDFVAKQYVFRMDTARSGWARQYIDEVVSTKFLDELDSFAFIRAIQFLPVWSCTLKSMRRSFPLAPNIFDYVIFDEASQVDLPSAAPALYRAKHAVIVGDPMQLSHIAKVTRHVEESLASKNNILAERKLYPGRIRYTDVSLYKSAERSQHGPPFMLLNHYRSEDAIAALFNKVFYGGRLRVLTRTSASEIPPNLNPLRWIDCKGATQKISSGSRVNTVEVMAVVRAATKILAMVQDKPLSLGIVTPFSAQQDAIHRALLRALDPEVVERHHVQVLTAHKFQGSEKDIMLVSLVLAAQGSGNSDHWYDVYPQILNVALSRAKHLLWIFGDQEFCRHRPGTLGRLAQSFDDIQNQQAEDETIRARQMDSPAERRMFELLTRMPLKQLGYRLIPKHVAKRYTLDFALVGPAKINIECDGFQHKLVADLPVVEDVERDEFLIAGGWHVCRVPNHRIWTEPEAVTQEIVGLAQQAALPIDGLQNQGHSIEQEAIDL